MNTRINQERVKVIRLGKSWTQQKLADEAKVSLRSIQRIEREGIASLQSRAAIASAFGIEPTELAIDHVQHDSILELLVILVLFSYSSFYLGLTFFDIPIEALPIWSIPILPSVTILIFGSIIQMSATRFRKQIYSMMGCSFLALLLSPPDPSFKQISFALVLWIIFEFLKFAIHGISQRTTVILASSK